MTRNQNKLNQVKVKRLESHWEKETEWPKSAKVIYEFAWLILFCFVDFLCLTPLSAIFQLYHGDQFQWWKKPEYPERTTNHGQTTGKLYHLRLRVECTLFCNLQSQAQTHAVLVIGLYELLGNPTTQLIEPPTLNLHGTVKTEQKYK